MTYSHKSPMHKLLASAGAVSIVAASFAAVPASFALRILLQQQLRTTVLAATLPLPQPATRAFPVNISWRIRTATCTPHSLMAAPRF